jgi:uncharacterized protein (DUF697 family)
MAFAKPTAVKGLVRLFSIGKGLLKEDLVSVQSRPFTFALVGTAENRTWAMERLGLNPGNAAHFDTIHEAMQASEPLILRVDEDGRQSESFLLAQAAAVLRASGDLRIAIASKSERLRPIIIDQITREWAQKNAKRAALDSLPGIFPVLDFLLPLTGAGDMIVLTHNQLRMVLEIGACHNLQPDPKARITELLPVIGGAFGWRAVARELVAFAPFGTGVVVSAGVAYAGTTAVGRTVDYFYCSGGKKLDLAQAARDVAAEAISRAKSIARLMRREGAQRIGTAPV